jgi:hypothetical protein
MEKLPLRLLAGGRRERAYELSEPFAGTAGSPTQPFERIRELRR